MMCESSHCLFFEVASLVPETWKVDLSDPKMVILVEIFKVRI